MALTTRANLAAFVWGLAEGSLFFIVPDVLLTALALSRLRTALIACIWAVAGALCGGLIMHAWGATAPVEAWAILDHVPAIGPAMEHRVQASMAEHGLVAMFQGPVTGTPYKLYAVAAGQLHMELLPFLLISIPVRGIRFVLAVLLAHAIVGRAPKRLRLSVLAGWWLLNYAVYFSIMGW